MTPTRSPKPTAAARPASTRGATTTRWRGMPADERRAERRRLLLDAAFDSLGTDGLAGTTVRGVCEATQLNPRYFYESFPDLDALLVAVFDRTAEEAFAVMLQAVEPYVAGGDPDPRAVTRAGIDSFVRHVTADPRRARVLFIEGLGNVALSRRRMESMHTLASAMEADAVARRGDATVDPAVTIAANIVVGGMAELMLAWLHGRLDVSIDELVETASALFVALGTATADLERGRSTSARPRRRR